MDKRILTERDICTKFITPALRRAGWDEMLQIREEVSFTKGRIIVRGSTGGAEEAFASAFGRASTFGTCSALGLLRRGMAYTVA